MICFLLACNGFGLGEGGVCTTNVHTKHTLQIYEKLSYEALNRHFCQTRVMPSLFSWLCFVLSFCLSWYVGLEALLIFLFGIVCRKKYKCATKSVGYFIRVNILCRSLALIN